MKQVIVFCIAVSCCFSCQKTERGAPDVETLSRKFFDTLRDGNFSKSEFLLPDKGTFRKIEEQRGVKVSDTEAAYAEFIKGAEASFDSVRQMVPDWQSTRFLRSTTEAGNAGNLATMIITTKFESGTDHLKYTITGTRFNNRWYYQGDVHWVNKSEESTTPTM